MSQSPWGRERPCLPEASPRDLRRVLPGSRRDLSPRPLPVSLSGVGSGQGAQVGGPGEGNPVASCGRGIPRGRGRGAGVFPREPNRVSGARSAAGRPQTQVLASSREAAALREEPGRWGGCVSPALKALAPPYSAATLKRPPGAVGKERGPCLTGAPIFSASSSRASQARRLVAHWFLRLENGSDVAPIPWGRSEGSGRGCRKNGLRWVFPESGGFKFWAPKARPPKARSWG